MTDTKSLLDEIEAIIAYDSESWPLRCSLSSTQINRIAEIVKEIKNNRGHTTCQNCHTDPINTHAADNHDGTVTYSCLCGKTKI